MTIDHPGHHLWTLDELEALPTLCVGQADDLKYDDGIYRVWLCRCGVDDGMPFDHQVTVEKQNGGRWTTFDTYAAG